MALLHEQIEGKYEILEKIREGGMGAIYKVRHRLLDEVRVVKVIRSHSAPGSGAGERFLREARAAIRLRHPNIAVLHDFAVDADGNAFIVMEFIDGWTLLEVLSGYGPPPLPLALEIARQALKALAYLHRQKIVHRDISPDNLMLTRDVDGLPLVKLIDLGIAKALEGGDGLTTTGSFLGKPRYAAPEQFGGTGLDVRSDLYSFGVVFYELLTGRCPISGQDPPSYMAGHLLRPPLDFALSDPDGSLPDDLREIVLQALAKKPEERLGSADELARAVQSVHARFPFSARDLDAMLGVLLPLAPIHEAFAPAAPGSTQDRLDWQFAMNETPPPESRTEATPSPGDADLQAMETRILRAALPPPPKPDRAAILMGPAEGEEELSLDATWATRPWRRPSGLPVTAPAAPPAPIMVELPPVRRRLLPLAAGLVLAAVALGSGIGWYLRQG
ncbi:MAG TPA: serine/threonine-protein kinase, partial [Thermoanaerobaculia bacterium]|nr:serine/threonine-protein kinase [Thermoanaerobaculia bacterium]